MKQLLTLLLLALSSSLLAQDGIFGVWKTIDDNTGKPRAQVEIFEKDGKAYGKIIKLYRGPDEEQDPICDKCEGDEKDQKIIGMQIIKGMEKDGEEWEDGTILDAESGKTYSCKLWVEEGKLQVRGYVAFFYRTQEWLRVE